MEEALRAHLIGDTAIAALIGARIFPVSRAQGSALPALTYQVISGAPLYADDGETGLSEGRVQIDCWGETYTSAKGLARAVTDRMSAFHGTVSGVAFQYMLLDTEQDLRETGSNAAEYLFRTSLDFIIWHG